MKHSSSQLIKHQVQLLWLLHLSDPLRKRIVMWDLFVCIMHSPSLQVESGELQGGCRPFHKLMGQIYKIRKAIWVFHKRAIWWGIKRIPKKKQGDNNFSNTWSLWFKFCWRTCKQIYFKPVRISGNQCVFNLRKSVASLSHEKEILTSGSLVTLVKSAEYPNHPDSLFCHIKPIIFIEVIIPQSICWQHGISVSMMSSKLQISQLYRGFGFLLPSLCCLGWRAWCQSPQILDRKKHCYQRMQRPPGSTSEGSMEP